jgi:hypothetical protein
MVIEKPVQVKRQHDTDGKGYKQLNVFDKAKIPSPPTGSSGSGASPESKKGHEKIPTQSTKPARPDRKRSAKPIQQVESDRMCEICDFRYKYYLFIF